jgi:hypothetical protein
LPAAGIVVARARTAWSPGLVIRRLPGWADSASDTIVTVRRRTWGQIWQFRRRIPPLHPAPERFGTFCCQLCGAGAAGLDFDLWRQMTVEHLIGESQGGYLRQILASLAGRFPGLSAAERAEFAAQIDAANTVTACSFCNATTSRAQAPTSMTALIETAPDGTPEDIRRHVIAGLDGILAAKRKEVEWKLASVRKAFDSRVAPGLTEARLAEASEPPTTVAGSDVRMVAERITSNVAVPRASS